MVKKKRKIVWDIKARESLKEIYDYVKADSVTGARKIKNEIYETTRILPDQPEIFATDTLKINNDGSYRAFFIYSYRIAYKITDEFIIILSIRHTSREPEEY